MEQLTFEFGETPREVIREQRSLTPPSDVAQGLTWALWMDVDHLLTVLDALRQTAGAGDPHALAALRSISDRDRLDGSIPVAPSHDAYRLRIAILAALGIKEQ